MKLGIREETLFSSQVKQLCCGQGVFLLDLHPICVRQELQPEGACNFSGNCHLNSIPTCCNGERQT